MVINGKAGMQFMGDWAKGEFRPPNKKPGTDYVCAPVPGTEKAYTFNIDSFVLFQQKDKGQRAGAAGPREDDHVAGVPGAVQPEQGLDPGSPRRQDGQVRRLREEVVPKDFVARPSPAAVPSIAHGMAVPPAAEGAIKDVVTKFMNDDKDSPRMRRPRS